MGKRITQVMMVPTLADAVALAQVFDPENEVRHGALGHTTSAKVFSMRRK